MQKAVSKFPIIVLSLLFGLIGAVNGQKLDYRLQVADSLFASKQYTQSFEHYEKILQNNQFTPAMLLKMAYIQEGLGHVGLGLYYLNLYYFSTHDTGANQKMEDLAKKYDLQGYQQDDSTWLLMQYSQYYLYISIFLGVGCLVLLVVAFEQKRKGIKPVGALVVLVLLSMIFTIHINFGRDFSYGIVADDNTYIMSGPSAGADIIAVVEGGHRLKILGKKDVWVKVRWNDQPAFVKQNGLLSIKGS